METLKQDSAYKLGWDIFWQKKRDLSYKYNPYDKISGQWLMFNEGYNAAQQHYLLNHLNFGGFISDLKDLCEKYKITSLVTGCGNKCGSGGIIEDENGNSFRFSIRI